MLPGLRRFLSGKPPSGGEPNTTADEIPEGPNPQFKHASEKWLAERNIPFCDWLGTNEVKLRPAREVAERALVLQAIGESSSVDGEELFDSEEVLEWLRQTGIEHALTPVEAEYLHNKRDPEVQNQMGWRCEAAWALAWALRWTEDLGGYVCIPHLDFFGQTILKPDGRHMLDNLQLRSAEELGQEEDLTVRIHWAFRDAQINRRPYSPWMDAFDLGVIMERHHAFSWLVDADTPWDEVTLDT